MSLFFYLTTYSKAIVNPNNIKESEKTTGSNVVNFIAVCSTSYTGTYQVGATGTWTSVTAALTDLKTCMTGSVTIELQSSYNCTVETYPLNFSNLPTSATNSLLIRPISGIAAAVTLSASTGTAIVYFNGADYVTIDGRPGGTGASSLTIENTNTAAGAAVTFSNDATYNLLSYCTLKSNYGSQTIGVVHFGNGVASGTGNSYNTIDNCVIDGTATNATPATADGVAENGIYSSSSTAAVPNKNNTIRYTEFINIYIAQSAHLSTRAILLETGNTEWNISNNYFYDPVSRVPSTQNPVHSSIEITSGDAYSLDDNQFGGNNKVMSGSWTYTKPASGNSTYFNYNAMKLTLGTTNTTYIRRNTIKKFSFTVYYHSSHYWKGIEVLAGKVEIGTGNGNGNTIGDASAASIQLLCNSTPPSTPNFIGIEVVSSSTVNISNNVIAGFTTQNTSGFDMNLYAIKTSSTGVFTVSSNTIGSTSTANSIQLGGSSTAGGVCSFYGINNSASGLTTISSNIIKNISVYGTGASKLYGIVNTSGADNSIISTNTISSISMSDAGSTGTTSCIYNSAVATMSIQNNIVLSSTHNNGEFNGINCEIGTSSSKTLAVQSNTIGGALTNSIAIGDNGDKIVSGINITSVGNKFNVNLNQISYLIGNQTGTGIFYNLKGIYTNSISATQPDFDFNENRIEYLINKSNQTGSANTVYGIDVGSTSTTLSTIKKNIVRYLCISTAGTNSEIRGMSFASKNNYFVNNFIQFINSDGVTTYTVRNQYRGLSLGTGTNVVYYNTIDVGGNSGAASANGNSYCLIGGNSSNYTLKNNIFQNTRVTSTNHEHVLLGLGTTNSNTVLLDYNYYASTTTFTFAYVNNGSTPYTNVTFTTAALGGLNSLYKTTGITINDDASLSAATISSVGIGADFSNPATYKYCQDDIYYTVGNRATSGGTKGCYEAASSDLPIELTRFTGDCSNGKVILNWQTASEKNNNQFHIQRSSDGVYFETIGSVAGAGNSEQLRNYTFVDEDEVDGISYYRLSQTDYDGKESQSQIISVEHVCGDNQESVIDVYPNPAQSNFILDVKLFKKVEVSVEILDALGREVKSMSSKKYDIGLQSFDMDISNFDSGIYFVRVTINGKLNLKKVVKL
jgi:hypothetical protein